MKPRSTGLLLALPVLALTAACSGGGSGGGGGGTGVQAVIIGDGESFQAALDAIGALSAATGKSVSVNVPANATRVFVFLDATGTSFPKNAVASTTQATNSGTDPIVALVGQPTDPFDANDPGYIAAFTLATSVFGQHELAIDLTTSTAASPFLGNTFTVTTFATSTSVTTTNCFEVFVFIDPTSADVFEAGSANNTTTDATALDLLFEPDPLGGPGNVANVQALSIHDASDVDFYSFTLATTSTVTVAFGNGGFTSVNRTSVPPGAISAFAPARLDLTVFDPQSSPDGFASSNTANNNEGLLQRAINAGTRGPGTYIIRVQADTPGETASYVLRVTIE